MTTRAEKAIKTRAKKQRDLDNCHEFIVKIISPLFASAIEHGYSDKIEVSGRTIQDEYGLKAKHCFELMFKLLQRGGINLKGEKYKSVWVPNKAAIAPYLFWSQNTPFSEMTCKSLLKALKDEQIIQLQWLKRTQSWVSKIMRDAALAHKRKQDNLARPAKDFDKEEQNAIYY